MKDIQAYRDSALSFFDDMKENLRGFFEDFPVWSSNARLLAMDIREEDQCYVVEAELPGISEKDLRVELEQNALTIASRQQEQSEEKKAGYLRRERRSTVAQRRVSLPADADESKIDAPFKNVLLTVTLPKGGESPRRRSITVKSG